MNLFVTLLFWLMLYPAIKDDYAMKYGWVALHGGPLLLQLFEFAFNKIIVERN